MLYYESYTDFMASKQDSGPVTTDHYLRWRQAVTSTCASVSIHNVTSPQPKTKEE